MKDESLIKRELFELSHEIFKIQADMHKSDYEKTHASMLKCLGRLGDLIILNHQWETGQTHPLKDLELLNIKRTRPDKQG